MGVHMKWLIIASITLLILIGCTSEPDKVDNTDLVNEQIPTKEHRIVFVNYYATDIDQELWNSEVLFTEDEIEWIDWKNYTIYFNDDFLDTLNTEYQEMTEAELMDFSYIGGSKLFGTNARDGFQLLIDDEAIIEGHYEQSYLSSFWPPGYVVQDEIGGISFNHRSSGRMINDDRDDERLIDVFVELELLDSRDVVVEDEFDVAMVEQELDSLSSDDIALMGITIGSSYADCIEIFGEPLVLKPIEAENIVVNKGHFAVVDFTDFTIVFDTDENYELDSSKASVVELDMEGGNVLTSKGVGIGFEVDEILDTYGLSNDDFIVDPYEGFIGASRINGMGSEYSDEFEYDGYISVTDQKEPVALIFLIKDFVVERIVIRHLTAG